ncbi:MAG TPA: hypothetical protein VHC22_32755 [Pirellulales bacterium]|nr:hypothetical protein [Pirellulales bacterium]
MNKAFVREPDDTGAANCPRCGSLGVAVGNATLVGQLEADDRRHLPESAYYCPYPRCEVGYFDRFDRWVAAEKLLHPAYPKDSGAPICPCFDFGTEEIDADVRERGTRRVKELLARTKSPQARCITLSPSGQCCMPEVQRYFMRLREESV